MTSSKRLGFDACHLVIVIWRLEFGVCLSYQKGNLKIPMSKSQINSKFQFSISNHFGHSNLELRYYLVFGASISVLPPLGGKRLLELLDGGFRPRLKVVVQLLFGGDIA